MSARATVAVSTSPDTKLSASSPQRAANKSRGGMRGSRTGSSASSAAMSNVAMGFSSTKCTQLEMLNSLQIGSTGFYVPVPSVAFGKLRDPWAAVPCSISCRRAPRRLCKVESSCGPFATPQSTVVQSKSQSSRLSTLDWRGSLTAAVGPPRMECGRDSNALPDGKSSTWE